MKFFKFGFLCLFFIFLNFNLAFANNSTVTLPEPPDVSGYKYKYVYMYNYNNETFYRIIYHNCDSLVYSSSKNGSISFGENSRRYKLDGEVWTFDEDFVISGIISDFETFGVQSLYSDVNIFNSDGSSFFCRTPITMGIYSGVSGGQIVTMILTVLLGLVKYLIPLVIFVIGFYKGYRLLKSALLI